ncbi:hypothetical protein CYMTET_49953 [Cymbomonas tetramitiformis]|uniref:Uncharacterized protein n=1 Tax=Cymbomonas tetramitiformis TaxID=36881 RepID=A0AAE0BR51_9CHLO|nr:hypothetical protein CYMTET_49953 [Cymbomonas tetramitiformis]|eukprot:gene9551-11315_t
MAAPAEVQLQIADTSGVMQSMRTEEQKAPLPVVHLSNSPSSSTLALLILSLVGIIATFALACVTLGYVVDIDNCDDTPNEVVKVVQNYTHITDYVATCLDGRHNALTGPSNAITGENICAGVKYTVEGIQDSDGNYMFANSQCIVDNIVAVMEQAGGNVTVGYHGTMDSVGRGDHPIQTPYWQAGLCPVNVHWHLGAEHLSVGQYDEKGTGPSTASDEEPHRKLLAGDVRNGNMCHLYDATDETFTKEYDWKHCVDMHVGQTYEVHWPHSAAGACGTPNQYQTPFYDGVFCNLGLVNLSIVEKQVGVQAQVFTIVNDERYYYPDLMRGMIVDGARGTNMTYYTGSTTGTSRDNQICSNYAPITWQVDRVCSVISASSFDKMCADMKAQRDDMSDDFYAHGSRITVADHLTANNQVWKYTE